MLRRLLILSFLLALPLTAHAACSLQMTMTCSTGSCSATTINNGTGSCSGQFVTAFMVNAPNVSLAGATNTLGLQQCFDSSVLGPQATTPFVFCLGQASLPPGASFNSSTGIRSQGSAASLPVIAITEVVDSTSEQGTTFAYAFNQLSVPTCTPIAVVASQVQSGLDYNIAWSQTIDPQTQYQIDESTTSDFSANVTSRTVSGTSATFRHDVQAPTSFYYRVRATSCSGAPGPYSSTVSTIVLAPLTISSGSAEAANVVLPLGSTTPFSFSLQIPPISGKTALATNYTASSDKPYLVPTPASGTIPPQGLTLTVTAAPSGLPPGASTGTITVTNSDTGAKVAVVPVSVTLAPPVGPGSKSLPTANTLIVPVVTHVNGATAPFESDVRLANAGDAATTYQLLLTPTRTDGTKGGKAAQVTVGAGQTLALNDIARTLFGFGATGQPTDVGFGSLEIRPLNDSAPRTYASSRTYATTPHGTYGQFIAAIPFSAFASLGSALPFPLGGGTGSGQPLSLQQVAQSAKFRTNLGLVEGSGTPAAGRVNVYNDAGTKIASVPFLLQAGEHQQLNGFLANNGITALDDGRIEIALESPTGAVTAYASVVDNVTSDPLAVTPVQPALISATRYVVPGIADLVGGNTFTRTSASITAAESRLMSRRRSTRKTTARSCRSLRRS